MQKRVASTSAPLRDAGSIAKLPPNQLSLATTINLPDWYGALQPGVYELQLKYRELGGAEIQSNTVMFEVLH